MSSSEIVAWQAGAHIAQEAIRLIEAGVPVDELPDEPLTAEILLAKTRLGDEAFSYWVLKGSVDAAEALSSDG